VLCKDPKEGPKYICLNANFVYVNLFSYASPEPILPDCLTWKRVAG